MRRWTIWGWGLVGAVLCIACGSAGAVMTPTGLPVARADSPTLAPVVTATLPAPTALPGSSAPPDAAADPCALDQAALDAPAARYDVEAEIDAQSRTVTAAMRATYRNLTGVPLTTLVFNIDANRTVGAFNLDQITLRSAPPASVASRLNAGDIGLGMVGYTLNGARLEVAFSAPLRPGCPVAFDLRFSVRAYALQDARMKYLAYTYRQLNLGYWLPEVAPFIDGGWRTPDSWSTGEYTYSEIADFYVEAHLTNLPGGYLIGPGTVVQRDASTWAFTFQRGRSFTMAVTDRMAMRSVRTRDGLQIDLYYFPPEAVPSPATPESGVPIADPDPSQHALNIAREAAERYTALFGPMPYDRLVVIEGDFDDGMEFSGMVYVGTHWFTSYRGRFDSWLTLITAHEVSHQWWYALVTSDQGLAPYLDEAIALYCELLYLESKTPEVVAWWWAFRVDKHQPAGYVDSPVFDYWNVRAYINAIYLRGAQMLHEIRALIGDEAFMAWLNAYVKVGAGRIVTPADFWGALSRGDYLRTRSIRQSYLRNFDPLGLETTPAPDTGK